MPSVWAKYCVFAFRVPAAGAEGCPWGSKSREFFCFLSTGQIRWASKAVNGARSLNGKERQESVRGPFQGR